MNGLTKLALVVVAGTSCGGAYAAGSLEEWEMTTTMAGGPMPMAPQKMIVCQKKSDSMQPPTQAQSDCKITSMGGSRSKGTFTMECKGEHPATIKGEGSQTADTMEGTMTIITSGMEIKQSYTGKRLGSCDKEGGRSVGGSGMPSMPSMDMQSMMDPRNRAPAGASGALPPGADDRRAGSGSKAAPPAPADAPAPEAKKEEPKDAAGKAVDAAKKALNGLLSF